MQIGVICRLLRIGFIEKSRCRICGRRRGVWGTIAVVESGGSNWRSKISPFVLEIYAGANAVENGRVPKNGGPLADTVHTHTGE